MAAISLWRALRDVIRYFLTWSRVLFVHKLAALCLVALDWPTNPNMRTFLLKQTRPPQARSYFLLQSHVRLLWSA